MSDMGCEGAREMLPEYVVGGLSQTTRRELEAHLSTCLECREEAELVTLLSGSRPEAPAALAGRIHAALERQRRVVLRPWWGVAAAAVAAVALGIGVTSRQEGGTLAVPAYVAGVDEDEMWLTDDGLIAGAPALDGLSEDDLEQLLAEMSGGQA
jgi:anti-sigma factor RsiW